MPLILPKTGEAQTEFTVDERGLVINRSQDVAPLIKSARELQKAGIVGSKDNRHVARIPHVLIEKVANGNGLDLNDFADRQAIKELIKRKIQSGEWSRFMVHDRGGR